MSYLQTCEKKMVAVRPLDVIANELNVYGETFRFAADGTPRNNAVWNSRLTRELVAFFQDKITEYGSYLALLRSHLTACRC